MADNYLLIQPNEDGNPNTFLYGEKLQEFLDDPYETYGVDKFGNLAFLGANPDPNYWKDGTAVLLKVDAVVPKPAGKYVLP
jgi:hypothetical protein